MTLAVTWERAGTEVRLCDMGSSVARVAQGRRAAFQRRTKSSGPSAQDERVAGGSAGVDPDALVLQVGGEGGDAVLAAEAGVLEAAEGGQVADRAVGVDPDRAG